MHSNVLVNMMAFEKHSCSRSCLKPPHAAPIFVSVLQTSIMPCVAVALFATLACLMLKNLRRL
jgi:hypothetical protein